MRALRPSLTFAAVAGTLVGLALAAGCRRPPPVVGAPPIGYEAHLAEATRLDDEAARHAQAAEAARQGGPAYVCETAPESEQTTSGGERMHGTRVCDDAAAGDRRRHEREAARLRERADHHRGLARSLLDADRAACAGLGVDQLRDPPLRRLAARATVETIPGGARITLRGADLDAAALERELGCHRARAALLGHDPDYMPSEPMVVAGARLRVERTAAAVIVTVDAAAPDAAAIIVRRAQALVGR